MGVFRHPFEDISAGETTSWLDPKVQSTLNAIQVSLMFWRHAKVARDLIVLSTGYQEKQEELVGKTVWRGRCRLSDLFSRYLGFWRRASSCSNMLLEWQSPASFTSSCR